jgi:hypothetical protein
MIKAKEFWDWFKKNNSKYFYLNQIKDPEEKEKLLSDFLDHLHKYSKSLFFEIGGLPNSEQELIISAEGNIKAFSQAEKLVSLAPEIKDWQIIALKPPSGIDFITNYQGIELNPKEMWFLPLYQEDDPQALGLKIGFVEYNSRDNDRILNGVYQILDTILGEKEAAYRIDHVEVERLPADPENEGYIELHELPKFSDWWRKTNGKV